MNKIIYASATELAQAIHNKEVSSEEVVNAYLQRIEEVNPKLNAVVQLTAETARAEAREADAALACGDIKGPLHGVPMTIKDDTCTAGVTCTAGTKGLASFIPTQDAVVVARLRAAGAILLGKTNLPELGLAFETDNMVYGRTNNPYDLSRTPGGSSGGEAAIIAAGGSPLGIGNDMGGSVRLPAHFCGIAGIKPTTGRVPGTGISPGGPDWFEDMFWQYGPIARFVEDLILILPIIAGVDWCDPTVVPMPLGDPEKVDLKSLRVAFHMDNGVLSPTSETVGVVKKAVKVLSDAGIAVKEDQLEGIEQSFDILLGLFALEAAGLETYMQEIGTTEASPLLQKFIQLGQMSETTLPRLWELMDKRVRFNSSMLSFMEKYDVIVCPVCAYPALPHGATHDKLPAFSYTMTYNLTGWPGVVVRGGTSPEGLPIGVQVVARPWREHVALAVARYIETALGGWQPPPL